MSEKNFRAKNLHALRRSSVSFGIAGYLTAIAGVLATTGIIHLIPGADHVANISLLYLLIVIASAHRFGSGPAILASLLAVLSFDWFFVEPRHTFTANNPAEWLALGVFLVTAIVISQLTANLQLRAEVARRRERETAALAKASWAVASQVSHQRTLEEVLRQITGVIDCKAAAIVARENLGEVPALEVVAAHETLAGVLPDFVAGDDDQLLARVLEEGSTLEVERADFRGFENAVYLPLIIEGRRVGVLYLQRVESGVLSVEERRVLESLANHAAVSLERRRLAQTEAQTEILLQTDKLKTALLSMVSHDFRSPLAAIKASVTGLLQDGSPWDAATQRELLSGINQETDRLNRMVGDILALSRLEAEAWRPQCELIAPDELVGATLDTLSAEDNARIRVSLNCAGLEASLDSVQIVQVLHNLLENALKYSPAQSAVELCVSRGQGVLVMEVSDRGYGIATGEEERIFERFYRAARWRETAVPGSGIGLAVCRGLVEAHGGVLTAANRAGGGAVFRATLPLHQE